MLVRISAVALLSLFIACSPAKKVAQSSDTLLENLKKHVEYLADDKLEGRRAGTEGERLAMVYIANEFTKIGLEAKGTNGYFQHFPIYEGKLISSKSTFTIDGTTLIPAVDFYPFPFSAQKEISETATPAIRENGSTWFMDLKSTFEENIHNLHFSLNDHVFNQSKEAQAQGAKAVVFYNSSTQADLFKYNGKDKNEALNIPVVYLPNTSAKKYITDITDPLTIKISPAFEEGKRTGTNVIGYIDNKAATTIIIGAHFDHIGYGEDGNSRAENVHQIHNGADDNASGTAALIELAAKIKKANNQNNNYVFIAFGAEELGLFGSKYFVDNPTIDLSTANYMINMDMIGRMNDSSLTLTIGGFGTSPQWSEVITLQKFLIPSPETAPNATWINIKIDSSGTGASDHTSFYRKNIPVLFYFTGLHTDYHKPSDDADKINYAGQKMIVLHIYDLVQTLNNRGKLSFTATREQQTSTSARFSVGLGIMPDYAYSGYGVRADGISANRAAEKAGMKAGDILVGIGATVVKDMESYMQALSNFKKGDKTTIKFKRGDQTIEANVEF